MKKKILFLCLVVLGFIYLNGCLAVETKEYNFKLKKDGSGSGVIKFINIMSDTKDSSATVDADYQNLIESYFNGDKLLEDMPGVKNIKKRLFEEDNQLCGEVTFDFDKITDLKFYKYKQDGPWCYYIGSSPASFFSVESYFSSNGEFGGEKMPVIFWDGKVKEFTFKTTLTAPSDKTLSLLSLWKEKGDK